MIGTLHGCTPLHRPFHGKSCDNSAVARLHVSRPRARAPVCACARTRVRANRVLPVQPRYEEICTSKNQSSY